MNRRTFIKAGMIAVANFSSISLIGNENNLKLVYFNNYPPFSWADSNKHMRGILVDVLDEALQRRMGINVSHKGYPWSRAQIFVKKGQADAFCTVPTNERRTYTSISQEPVIISEFKLYTGINHPKIDQLKAIKALKELEGYTIGHFSGGGWAKRNLKGLKVNWTTTLDSTLRMLSRGRVDVHVNSSHVIRYTIRKLGLKERITELPSVISANPFHLCIGKHSDTAGILPEFDQTLRKMKAEGVTKEILAKYS